MTKISMNQVLKNFFWLALRPPNLTLRLFFKVRKEGGINRKIGGIMHFGLEERLNVLIFNIEFGHADL